MPHMMHSDASRRWLDDSGIWSCRIKLPTDNSRLVEDAAAHQPQEMAPSNTMDVAIETGSPSSRRNKGKLAEAIQSMGNLSSMELDMPTDPDAQATVTDFLDFTEYLTSDMSRSLTLIGNLDQTYHDASANLHDSTMIYARLPEHPANGRPDPVKQRAEISQNLAEALSARILSHAEAIRMADNVDRHYNRAKAIAAKLQAMLDGYPPTREPSPVPKIKSPVVSKAPKITLRLDGGGARPLEHQPRVRKHRAPRITVPGEVLAPYELDYESYGSASESYSDDEPLTPRATPGASLGNGRIKLNVSRKDRRDRGPKPPRGPRPVGSMGTNVHSSVAGISTSNALALIPPPPEDAVIGDEHLPWLQLNAWELAKLRKRMKKNAIWSPSDTMIARELKIVGRGIEAYRAAKAKAEADGVPFDQPQPPQLRGETVHAEGAISVEALRAEEPQTSNRGMKLNEAKKLKRENQAKEAAKIAAEEAEESVRKMAHLGTSMKDLFTAATAPSSSKTPSKSHKKRKRESPPPEAEILKAETSTDGEATVKATRPPLKRTKTETPVPVPPPLVTKQTNPLPPIEPAPSVSSETAVWETPTEASAENLGVPLTGASPRKSSTPILPPTKDRKGSKKETKKPEQVVSTRPRRSSAAPTPTPAPESLPAKRPTSSRSNAAAAIEPSTPTVVSTATADRPRRTSTARNTPAPEPRQTNKRTKRPAPGVVTTESEGSAAVSVGKRSGATRKKAGVKRKEKDGREGSAAQEIFDEIDDEGNIIDPDEPRYCLCNRVSFGTMIGCENNDCEKEWFHLECVGLTNSPPRTTKWYCPACRVTLGIGEKGEVNARGRKM